MVFLFLTNSKLNYVVARHAAGVQGDGHITRSPVVLDPPDHGLQVLQGARPLAQHIDSTWSHVKRHKIRRGVQIRQRYD